MLTRTRGRPLLRSRRAAAASPAFTRSMIRARSTWAKFAIKPDTNATGRERGIDAVFQ